MALADRAGVGSTPQFSAIMPVYNTGDHVRAAVQSVLDQTDPSFELLIIDDGSNDGSLEICQNLALTDPRVSVVSQRNAGQGVARNRGLDGARGKFIVFVDSDDTIEPDMFEATASLIGDADFLSFGFDFIDEDGNRRRPVAPYSKPSLTGPAIFHSALIDVDVFTVPWNKIYRRDVIEQHEVRFPVLRTWEDSYFSREMARVSHKAVFDQTVRYHALMRSGSTSRALAPSKLDDAIALFELEKRAFSAELTEPHVQHLFEAHTIKFMMQLLVLAALRTTSAEEYRRCYAIAADNGFTQDEADPAALAHLPLKVSVVRAMARHPILLRRVVRLAASLGLKPY
jgi:glycosyltransferase involved in cell wall biosynthesis